MPRTAVDAEECGEPQLASGGALLPRTVNLWLRWPEAGMLRTASHSASEAAERTVRPWILWTLLRPLSKAGRGTVFYSLCPPPHTHLSLSLSAFLFLQYVFSVPPGIFSLMFQIFPHSFSVSPCFCQDLASLHQPSSSVPFLLASTLSVPQAWYLLQED